MKTLLSLALVDVHRTRLCGLTTDSFFFFNFVSGSGRPTWLVGAVNSSSITAVTFTFPVALTGTLYYLRH